MDVLFRVLHLQEQQLSDDRVRDKVIDASADENDAILEQARVDIERAFATAVLFNDYGHVVIVLRHHRSRE